MRNVAFLFVFLAGCANGQPEVAAPVDVEGTWTADFLVNTSTNAPGREVSPFGELTLKAATYDAGGDWYVGNAVAVFRAYAVQGSIDMPLTDAQGEVLYEEVGTTTYRGTWQSDAYEGSTSLDVFLNCESIDFTVNRPDLQAVCGTPGFDATASAGCSRPEGATTLQCTFVKDDIVFTRLP